jgi:hypothetical protein
MPVAHLLGRGDAGLSSIATPAPAVLPRHVALVGLRDVDPPERANIAAWGVRAYTMRDIDERGLAAVMREALALAGDGTGGVYVSLDMDFIDPLAAPGVGTPVRGGLSYREAHLAMELVAEWGELSSFDAVEFNPILDRENARGHLPRGTPGDGARRRLRAAPRDGRRGGEPRARPAQRHRGARGRADGECAGAARALTRGVPVRRRVDLHRRTTSPSRGNSSSRTSSRPAGAAAPGWAGVGESSVRSDRFRAAAGPTARYRVASAGASSERQSA